MTAPLLPLLRQRSGLAWCAAVAFLLACGRPSAVTAAAAAVGTAPLAAAKTASRCSAASDPVECLLRAAAAGIDVLARSVEPVELVPGCVTLVKNGATPAGSQSRSTDSVAADDPAAATDAKLNEAGGSAEAALIDSITAFVKSRAISVRPPAYLLDSLKSTLIEARGKKDKYAGPLLMGAMMVAGTLLPIKLGALAMMSGKALMTSMLALMLSAILALKKLASGGGGGGGGHSGTTYEVINVPSHGGHGSHGRSLTNDGPAHGMAYGLQVNPTAATASDVTVTS